MGSNKAQRDLEASYSSWNNSDLLRNKWLKLTGLCDMKVNGKPQQIIRKQSPHSKSAMTP